MTVISNIPASLRRRPLPTLARVYRASVRRPTSALPISIHRNDRGTLACQGDAR